MNTVPNQDLTLRDIVRVFDRRKGTLLATVAVFFLLAVLVCVYMTRSYEAKGVIEMQKSASDSLNLDSLMGGAGQGGDGGDSLSANIDLQTEASVLQSDALALKVVRKLDLEKNRDFKPHFNPVYWFMGLFTPNGPADPKSAPLEASPHRLAHVLGVFHSHLKVAVTPGTRLIEVRYTNSDPKAAADVVNCLVQVLVDYTFQTKFTATNEASRWLEGQLGDLRKQSEDLEAKVVSMQRNTGLFGVGGVDLQGKPVIYSPVLDRLQASTTQLSQAEMNRILKASVYKAASSGNGEMISQLAGTAMGGSGGGVMGALALLQNLRTQEATLEAQIGQDAAVYGAAYPKLIEERASLEKVRRSIKDEIARIAERAKNDYGIALSAEQGARATYESDRAAAEKQNDTTIEYSILEREASQSQQLYEDLLKRLREAGILDGLRSTNLTVVDPATPPPLPSRPKVLMYLAIGLALGVFFGIVAALLMDVIDNKVQGAEEIEAMGMPLLGLVPQVKAEDIALLGMVEDSGFSAFNEAVRQLRSSLLISHSGKPPKIILVTSGSPGEGKSTLSLILSALLSRLDKKVLLVEADMRRPVLRKRGDVKLVGGLSVLLTDLDAVMEPVVNSNHPNLFIMPGGPVPPYPAELLGSDRMRSLLSDWEKDYDFIVLDCPPVLPVTDALVLEGLADATILVVRAGFTSRVSLSRSYSLLYQHAKNPALPTVGIVLNFVAPRSAEYYGYYGYYGSKGYEYHQEGGKDENS